MKGNSILGVQFLNFPFSFDVKLIKGSNFAVVSPFEGDFVWLIVANHTANIIHQNAFVKSF